MSGEAKIEIPGVNGQATFHSVEDIAKQMAAVKENEQQIYTHYMTRLMSGIVNNLTYLREFSLTGVKVFTEELELHRCHELQCRSQLLTEESLQEYLDGLTALRLRQAEENAAKIKAAEAARTESTKPQ